MTYAEMQTEYEKVDKEKWELLEALKREHEYAVTMRFRDMETMRTPMERHRDMAPDCPVCQLIRRVEG